MTVTQSDKAKQFRTLHEAPGAFVIANVWDGGSARMIASPDRSRRLFSGAREEIAGDIRTFAALGVHELIFDFRGQSIAESVEHLQRFVAEVIPLATG